MCSLYSKNKENHVFELVTNDKLIILCDALADVKGFCFLEKRFVDTTRRYGIYPFTLDRWNMTIEFKEYFERLAGESIYNLLPGIEKSMFC